MGKLPLQPAHLHRNRNVAAGLYLFPHQLELHSSSVPCEPDCDCPRVVTATGPEFFPWLTPLFLDRGDE